MAELKKKYGLITAICMVVGIVVGSGVFFKAEAMLNITNGDLPVALLSWLIGGCVMVISAYTFAVMGTKFEKINGVVDYSEALVGSKYAYYVGWFMATIYYPAMTSALAWLSARYTMVLFGFELNSAETMVLAFVYLILSFALNTLSPKLAGHFQVSTTVIKLIPLILMAVVGTIYGIKNGVLIDNMNSVVELVKDAEGNIVSSTQVARQGVSTHLILAGVCTSVFAYEGWVIATAINSELKDAKKNLPRALVLGTIIVVVVYMLYYIGISGSIKTAELLPNGAGLAFKTIFGNVAGTILTVFIAVSCLGTLNGLTLACDRGFYSLAARNHGPRPDFLGKLDHATEMPSNASIVALIFNALWLFYFYMANLTPFASYTGKGSIFLFDSTELPLICVYAFYLPLYVMLMVKGKEFNVFRRFIMPILSFAGACLFIYAAIAKHGIKNIGFIIVAGIIMLFGAILYSPRNVKQKARNKKQ
ncbi:MAG: APC family permease [Ruminococcus sp.]|nr:APC family permease [Ruminococcus sp.]